MANSTWLDMISNIFSYLSQLAYQYLTEISHAILLGILSAYSKNLIRATMSH